ncbi:MULTISPECIES: beta-galactosidase GalA [Asticcacaulis]|uniref:beta-galactosidase GalA n=1 Tax=Asticcacaulis TaxID=76890 RepID=UPI001AE21C95|nr:MULTISPECIES: beta-galactosidase GalA [Asticcacaulis]MBP2161017.1 beta-galactosidase [Asticcacaulis solisilvae]MDR6802062.1 beta-galactosidase [Asticcacaulis sp. BE141]
MTPNRREVLATASSLTLMASAGITWAQDKNEPVAKDEVGRMGRVRFNDGWRFAFGHLHDGEKDFGFGLDLRTYAKQGPDSGKVAQAAFDDSQWRQVTLPHDWAVELPFVPNPKASELKPNDRGEIWDPAANHGFKPLGREYPETSVGWYRKTFTLDTADKGKRIFIEFDGVFRSTLVMVNGYIVREHDGGYTGFSIDVTDFLNTDDKPNVIAVRVDASLGEGWFYEGAGIYRHVWLTKVNAVHVPQHGVLVRSKTDGTVEITTTVRNDSDVAQTVIVASSVNYLDVPSSNPDTRDDSSIDVPAWSSTDVVHNVKIVQPALWSVEQPNLYFINTNLIVKDQVVDQASTTFGFRDIKFDAEKGFFLNGKHLKLKGTCNHQDHAGVGAAIPDALQYYRLRLLKEMGCNAYRASHNPPTPEVLDACDELGLLVIDETRLMTSSKEGLENLRSMIVRDRNHPSIILWSVGNEEPQQGTERGAIITRTMKRLCNELDPTRGVTYAMDQGYGFGVTHEVDVLGFNYRTHLIDDFHAKYPHIPVIGSETASTVATRGEYIEDKANHIVPAYDTTAPWWATTGETWWTHAAEKPYMAGGFIWTGFDYRGEPTPFSEWPSISSQFGVFDTCGFPKDNYYYYRAWWRPEQPLLHLLPHWNWEEGKTVSVWAHSNCDEVELFVNGKSAGRKPVPRNRHAEWSVPYVPGKIEAFAYKGGKVLLKDKRETAGAPAKVVLSADRTALLGDDMDVAVLRAEVFDARGRPVPKASDLITFAVSGPGEVIGVGNGNPNSHEADKASQRKAFNGLCSAIVQTRGKGNITVTASGAGLTSGKVVLKAG